MKRICVVLLLILAQVLGAEPIQLFDDHHIPHPKLVELLQVAGMPPHYTLDSINAWSQKNLLRQGERWEQQNEKFESLAPILKPLLKELGFVDEIAPHHTEYQGALVLGALMPRVRIRIDYLMGQWKKGVRFPRIYFLVGVRPLEARHEPCMARTEYEMAQLLWKQTKIPQDMQNIEVFFINAPMKAKLQRPTFDDTVVAWLKTAPPPGRYLAVANAPYMVCADIILRSIAPEGYYFDTVGSPAKEDEKMAIYLDEVARSIYQMWKTTQ